jgi:hypothetical protein
MNIFKLEHVGLWHYGVFVAESGLMQPPGAEKRKTFRYSGSPVLMAGYDHPRLFHNQEEPSRAYPIIGELERVS